MATISGDSTLLEVAAIVSAALEKAGLKSVLSGGAAISIYTENRYESVDLDFVSSVAIHDLARILEPLGFERGAKGRARYFEHPSCNWYVEFPPEPVAVGSRIIGPNEWHAIDTPLGRLHVLSPTQMIMDRLAAYFWWNDQQSWGQALMVARSQVIDWEDLRVWAAEEGAPLEELDRFERLANG